MLDKFVKKRKPLEYILYTAIIFAGVLLDQITKLLTVAYLKPVGSVPIIKGVIHLTYVENDGAAFGMLDNARWVFMTTSVIMIVGMLAFLYLGHAESRLYEISIAMIISGGIGNMIDRIAYGYVVDFIDFALIDFAVFNGADSFVCVGGGLLILAFVMDIPKEYKAEKAGKKKEGSDEA